MNYFVKLTKKPSVAIWAMINGIWKSDARDDFKINMSTFGDIADEVCYGCAATCAIQEITGIEFKSSDILYTIDNRAEILFGRNYVDYLPDLNKFEDAIDEFRNGDPVDLLDLYGIEDEDISYISSNWKLRNNNWRKELIKIEIYVKQLEDRGY